MKRNFKLSKGLVMAVSVFFVLTIFIGVMSEDNESSENNESPVVEENIPDNSEPEEEYVPKEQTVPEETVVPEEETPIEPSESNEAEEALELVRPQIDSAFSGLNYSLRVVENSVVLVLDIPTDEIARGVVSGEWTNLVNNAEIATKNAKSFLQSQGNNSSMSILLGDVAADSYYLCVMDGVVIYDVSDKLLQ